MSTTTEADMDTTHGDPRIHRLSREAGGWRLKYREAEKRIAELEARLGASPTSGDASAAVQPAKDEDRGSVPAPQAVDASSKAAAAGAVAGDQDDDDPDMVYEQQRFAELSRRAIVAELEAGGVMYGPEIYEIMVGRGTLTIDDDGNGALIVDGKAVPITKENVSRTVRSEFLRAEGSTGAGSHAPKGRAPESLNLDRALGGDVRYFNEHRAEVEAAMRKR